MKAKDRLAQMLRSNPEYASVKLEHSTGVLVPTSMGEREYVADLFAQKIISSKDELGGLATMHYQTIVFELDGHSHHSKRAKQKDAIRDARLLEKNIRTVRLETIDLTGKRQADDATIWAEIEHQLAK